MGGLLLLGLVAVGTAPRWGAGRIERELEDRLSNRLGLEVEIASTRLSWRTAELGGVRLRGDGIDMNLEHVTVHLDRRALRSAEIKVTTIEVEGGHLEAERGALEDLGRRARDMVEEPADPNRQSWLRRRTKLTPQRLSIDGLGFGIDDNERRVTGSLEATVDPADKSTEIEVRGLLAELGLGTPVRIQGITTALRMEAGGLRFPLTIEVEGASAELNENISVAGVHGNLTIVDAEASTLEVELTGGFSDVAPAATQSAGVHSQELWSIAGSFARDLSAGEIEVDMQAFELARVPEVLGRLPLVESEAATVGGHLEIGFGGGVAKLEGRVTLAGLNVSHQLLAREVVRDVGFSVEIDAEIDPVARRLTLHRLTLGRAGVELIANGEIVHAAVREERRYRVTLEIPEVDCQKVLDAIPHELAPGLRGFELDGTFGATLDIEANFSNLDDLRLEGTVDSEHCRVRKAPPLATPKRLRGGFTHRVTMRDGRTRTLRLYSGSGSYTPLANVSRYMTEAVLTTEDGSFRRHEGFNSSQLEAALRRNLKAGKVRLGASTITMQMVKNVLLSHERTLSRKLQELFLTWWVEQALSKQRIMELYLNVIEFGPGIYGVTHAASHYYGKHPAELSSREAAYLALMLPSPVRRHVHYCKGAPSERFANKLRWIHDLMLTRERISEAEHAVYSTGELVFDLWDRGDPDACLEEIETVMAGTETQRALTGLLGDTSDTNWERAWVDAVATGKSWGVRPPLPELTLEILDGLGHDEHDEVGSDEQPGAPRIEASAPGDKDWMVPSQPVDVDPANADAPGHPAMDELG